MTTTSTIIVAFLATPASLHLDREQMFVPLEPSNQLEQMIKTMPIHPMNLDPKKIMGDQFVHNVKTIEARAEEINSIEFNRVVTAR